MSAKLKKEGEKMIEAKGPSRMPHRYRLFFNSSSNSLLEAFAFSQC
jgi:hypothetical protein